MALTCTYICFFIFIRQVSFNFTDKLKVTIGLKITESESLKYSKQQGFVGNNFRNVFSQNYSAHFAFRSKCAESFLDVKKGTDWHTVDRTTLSILNIPL